MANQSSDELAVEVLRACASTAPAPWYPTLLGADLGIPRPMLDTMLDELRWAGLLQLTDWVAGRGQGYALTPVGAEVLQNPQLLQKRRRGPMSAPAEPAGENLRSNQLATWNRGEAVRDALLGAAVPKVTNFLILINVIVFGYGCLRASQEQMPLNNFIAGAQDQKVIRILRETGSATRADIEPPNHQWWRLLTCCFVHIGLLHLGVNMYSLFIVGPLLERMWGHRRYLVLYLLAGFIGSCAGVIFEGALAGASGAIWGLMASMGAWVVLNRAFLPEALYRTWLRQLFFVLLLNLLITFGVPGISIAGHIGGGTAGLLLAFPLEYIRYGRGWQRPLSWLALLAMPLVSVMLVAASFADLPDQSPLTPEEQQARAQYHKVLQNADEMVDNLYQKVAGPVLKKDLKDLQENPVQFQGIGLSFRATARMVGKVSADHLGKGGPFPSQRFEKAVHAAKEYLATAADFYEKFGTSLEQPETWTPQKREELRAIWTKAVNLRRQWSRSPIFQADDE